MLTPKPPCPKILLWSCDQLKNSCIFEKSVIFASNITVHEVSRDRHRGVIGTVRNIPVDFKNMRSFEFWELRFI